MPDPTAPSPSAPASPDARIVALVAEALPGARVLSVQAVGEDLAAAAPTAKGAGYGAPLRIELECAGDRRVLVLHTATKNRFGHDRRADRAAEALLAADTFAEIPLHVRVVDVGAFRGASGHVSLSDTGEFYLLTEWGDGAPYAEDLRRVAESGKLEGADVHRVQSLAAYLVSLHGKRLSRPFASERALRDLFGSGEGIFGIVDGYPENGAGVERARLRRIEELCLDWRWRLKEIERPLVRTHGDFHPFNVLFDAASRLVLLDTSRGSAGEAADDVTCMAINYPFFALERPGSWRAAFRELWFGFWQRYLELAGDRRVLEVAAPFLAWRALVLASPLWYPKLLPESRARLLDFAEAALRAERFEPSLVEDMFA